MAVASAHMLPKGRQSLTFTLPMLHPLPAAHSVWGPQHTMLTQHRVGHQQAVKTSSTLQILPCSYGRQQDLPHLPYQPSLELLKEQHRTL